MLYGYLVRYCASLTGSGIPQSLSTVTASIVLPELLDTRGLVKRVKEKREKEILVSR